VFYSRLRALKLRGGNRSRDRQPPIRLTAVVTTGQYHVSKLEVHGERPQTVEAPPSQPQSTLHPSYRSGARHGQDRVVSRQTVDDYK
jgi:hypothetical protein